MRYAVRSFLGLTVLACAAHASAQVTFYEGEGFRGRVVQVDRPVVNMEREGFNDRAASAVVDHGRWEVCEDARFAGHCVVLRPGSYDSLRGLGLYKQISSVRPVEDRRDVYNEAPQPLAAPTYDYRRRPSERLIQVPVTSTRAVYGPPEQRCWTERQPAYAPPERRDPNVPGAIIGGVIGGILGHQIGGGSGRTVATIGGAVGGTALGANIDRFGNGPAQPVPTTDVRRCETAAPSGPPQYWDVTYNYRGVQHRVQMSTPPQATLLVNDAGEPRL